MPLVFFGIPLEEKPQLLFAFECEDPDHGSLPNTVELCSLKPSKIHLLYSSEALAKDLCELPQAKIHYCKMSMM